jgi:hypothetical protein
MRRVQSSWFLRILARAVAGGFPSATPDKKARVKWFGQLQSNSAQHDTENVIMAVLTR